MQAARADETPRTWFRSERVFLSNGKWFFHTREGVDLGPYESQFEAEVEAGMLKALLCDRAPQGEASMAVIREFVFDSYATGRLLTPHFAQAAAG